MARIDKAEETLAYLLQFYSWLGWRDKVEEVWSLIETYLCQEDGC